MTPVIIRTIKKAFHLLLRLQTCFDIRGGRIGLQSDLGAWGDNGSQNVALSYS